MPWLVQLFFVFKKQGSVGFALQKPPIQWVKEKAKVVLKKKITITLSNTYGCVELDTIPFPLLKASQ